MSECDRIDTEADFDFLTALLPTDWEQKARELGALRRCRQIPNARVLLQLLLLHLAEGCSLRETAARAKHSGLATVTDVAISYRLCAAGEWFRWMSTELMSAWLVRQPPSVFWGRLERPGG